MIEASEPTAALVTAAFDLLCSRNVPVERWFRRETRFGQFCFLRRLEPKPHRLVGVFEGVMSVQYRDDNLVLRSRGWTRTVPPRILRMLEPEQLAAGIQHLSRSPRA